MHLISIALYVGDSVLFPLKRCILRAVQYDITLLSCLGKLFAHVLLARVKDKLISMHRKEQSGFTHGRSTIDRITTLNLILHSRRE